MSSSAGERQPFEDGGSGHGNGINQRSGHTTNSNDSNRSVLLSVEEILGLSQVHRHEDDGSENDNSDGLPYSSRASTLTRTPSPLSFSFRSESSAVVAAPPPPSQQRAQTWHATGNLWENYHSRTATAVPAYGRFRNGYDPNGNCNGNAAVEVSDDNDASRPHDGDDDDDDDYGDGDDLGNDDDDGDDDDDGSMTTFPESPPRPCQFVRLPPPPQRFEIPRLPPRFEKRVPSRSRSGPGTLSRTTTTDTAEFHSRRVRRSSTPPNRAIVEASFAPVEASRTTATTNTNRRPPAVTPTTTPCTTNPSIPAAAKKPTSRFEIFEDKLREHQGMNGILL